MTLTERLGEPRADAGCVCCQGLTGAVAFVLGKCLLTSGAPTGRVFVFRVSLAAVTSPVRDLFVRSDFYRLTRFGLKC